jgi:hypothetical protein
LQIVKDGTDYSPQDILKGIFKPLQEGSPKWIEADHRKFQNLKENLMLRIVPASAIKAAQRVRFAPNLDPATGSGLIHEECEREINLSNNVRLRAARVDVLAKQIAQEAGANLAALSDPGYVQGPNGNINGSFYMPEDSETYMHLIRTDPTTGISTAAEHPLNLPMPYESILDKEELDIHDDASVIDAGNGVQVRDFAYGTQSQPVPPTVPVDYGSVLSSRVKKVPVAPIYLRRSARPKRSGIASGSPTPSADRKRIRGSVDDNEATKKKLLTDVDMEKVKES